MEKLNVKAAEWILTEMERENKVRIPSLQASVAEVIISYLTRYHQALTYCSVGKTNLIRSRKK